MPLSLSQRNPKLVAQVDEAYERARLSAGETARGLGGTSLDAVLAADVAEAKEAGTLTGSGLEAITSPETRAAFETALANTERLFARIGLVAPTAEQLRASGIDLAQLATRFEAMGVGAKPELVIAPRLGVENWKRIFQGLQDDQAINRSGRIKNGGLYIDADVAKNWDSPSFQDTGSAPQCETDAGLSGLGTQWTVRIISGTETPTQTNVRHDDPNYPNKPTVNEYLTLQGVRLMNPDTEPIDSDTYTWLNGSFKDDSRAPCGVWYSGGGRVVLYWSGVGNANGSLGVRLPVWE